MITAYTITDEQIRGLAGRLGPNLADLVTRALSPLASACPTCAVECGTRCTDMTRTGYRAIKAPHATRLARQSEARARCAEILNARAAKEQR